MIRFHDRKNALPLTPAPEHSGPAEHFCQTLSVNVDNVKFSDRAFRELVRNTLLIVNYQAVNPQTAPHSKLKHI